MQLEQALRRTPKGEIAIKCSFRAVCLPTEVDICVINLVLKAKGKPKNQNLSIEILLLGKFFCLFLLEDFDLQPL